MQSTSPSTSSTQQLARTVFVMFLLAFFASRSTAQNVPPVIVQAPASLTKKHLHIAHGITDAEYREQVLNLIPLGSTYNEVEAFVLGEIKYEKRRTKDPRPDDVMEQSLVGDGLSFSCFFHSDAKNVLREEPPHIKLSDPNAPFAAAQGETFIFPTFYNRPFPWQMAFGVRVICLFDKNDRLIDIFVHNFAEKPPPLHLLQPFG